jgi:hypothetical protein
MNPVRPTTLREDRCGDGRMTRSPCAVALLLTLLAIGGCHSPVLSSTSESRLLASGQYEMIDQLDVPSVRGAEGCGAQALAAALAYTGDALDAASLAADLPWHDVGATPVDLLLAARRRNYGATIQRGDWEKLRACVRARRPALVMLDVGPEVHTLFVRIPTLRVMHWSVVSGVARDDSHILLATTRSRHHVVDRSDFERRWARSDHCLIVVSGRECNAPSGTECAVSAGADLTDNSPD